MNGVGNWATQQDGTCARIQCRDGRRECSFSECNVDRKILRALVTIDANDSVGFELIKEALAATDSGVAAPLIGSVVDNLPVAALLRNRTP